jgi:hypothetical protein
MLLVQHQAKVFADNGMSVYQDVAQVVPTFFQHA